MFDDEDKDFSIFDDKQIETLNKVDDDTVVDDDEDQAAKDAAAAAASGDDPNKGADDKSDLGGEDTPEAIKAAEEAAAKKAEEDKAEADRIAAEEAEAELAKDETPEQTEARHKKEAEDKAAKEAAAAAAAKKDEEKETFATKDDIRAALAEQHQTAEQQQAARKTMRNELRNELYPEGIDVDLKIKDSDNGIITGPSQIAGKLINPNTNELFTYEEAKDYWDNAQKAIDKAIEDREQLIDLYAENNQSFFEGTQRVEAKYGAWLKANPVEAKKLLDNFFKTAKVTKSGYITEMPLDVFGYYDTALSPMASVASQMELEKKAEEARKIAEDEKKNQEDRADLPVNSNTPPPKKKDELSSAFDRYFDR